MLVQVLVQEITPEGWDRAGPSRATREATDERAVAAAGARKAAPPEGASAMEDSDRPREAPEAPEAEEQTPRVAPLASPTTAASTASPSTSW